MRYVSLINESCGLKKGMVFEWDKHEGEYTTKEMPWFLSPLIGREEMQYRIKLKQFKK